jgi:hypothetical protein
MAGFSNQNHQKKEINHRDVKRNEEASHRISGSSDSEK